MDELSLIPPAMTLIGNARKETLGGREYLVVEAVILKEGILNGSHGPLYYPKEEVTANVGMWNGIPVTASHPVATMPDGTVRSVSARVPAVAHAYKIGTVYGDRVTNTQRRCDLWIDVLDANRIDARIVPALIRGDPTNVSTGIFSHRVPAGPTTNKWNGQEYTHTVAGIRADHLAVLMDEAGACSVRDGCGINLTSSFSPTEHTAYTIYNRKWTEKDRDALAASDFAGPHKSFPIETQTDVDAAAKLIGHADSPETVKAKVKAIARRKGLTVPAAWGDKGDTVTHNESDPYNLGIPGLPTFHGPCPGCGSMDYDGTVCPTCGKTFTTEETFHGATMNKTQTIEWLTTNCECWKGAKATLNSLDYDVLQGLKTTAEKAARLDLTINALKEIRAVVKAPETSTLADLPTLVKNATSMGAAAQEKDANTTKEPKKPQQTRKSSGSQEGGDKRGNMKKDGYEGEYDDDNESGEPTKMTKNQFKGILASVPGLKTYLVNMGFPASAVATADYEPGGTGKPQMGNENSGHERGAEIDVNEPMDEPGDKAPNAGNDKMAKGERTVKGGSGMMGDKEAVRNAVQTYFKSLTAKQYIDLAPPGVQEIFNSANEVVEKERLALMRQLTNNVGNRKDKEAKLLRLKDKTLPELRELVEFAGVVNTEKPVRREDEFLNNFFSSGAAPTETEVQVTNKAEPLLPNIDLYDVYE